MSSKSVTVQPSRTARELRTQVQILPGHAIDAPNIPNAYLDQIDNMPEPTPEAAPQVAGTEPTPITNGTTATEAADVTMADSTEIPISTESQPQTAPLPEAQPAPTPAPVSAPTPTPAPTAPASSRNSPHPTAPQQAPTQPVPHGSPTRVYLNQHVTPHLLEAMKHLATNEPEKPLKFLSEFLAMKSAEIEG
ncbi:hypothetical protein BU25DRAFT_490960 [Macroventuria anomochaeta]|uniref:Uncharacterized protein n=1 Tax=Macroventuria anomochaeta TaxID=301207 RepID=A0ACB6S320_9PLEO|nr:uncharacterized protein BU25DRAFT_490960 [Macroventuria anomochaeta]KAF2627788.1 hypothetical protein BU25DRAFT_490960 [Macroventuria anomochaeta]